MATTVYHCRLNPHACPPRAAPGYCEHHPWIELVHAGATVTTPSTPADPSPSMPRPTTSHGEAEGTGQAPAPTASWALCVPSVDVTIPIPVEGLDIGRDSPRFAAAPAMRQLDQLSRRHARLSWTGTVLYLEDLGSTNGTFVEDRRIHAPAPVTPTSRLRLAEDVEVWLVELTEEL